MNDYYKIVAKADTGIIKATFVKQKGHIRVIYGTRNPMIYSKYVAVNLDTIPERFIEENLLPVVDLQKKEPRLINLNTLLAPIEMVEEHQIPKAIADIDSFTGLFIKTDKEVSKQELNKFGINADLYANTLNAQVDKHFPMDLYRTILNNLMKKGAKQLNTKTAAILIKPEVYNMYEKQFKIFKPQVFKYSQGLLEEEYRIGQPKDVSAIAKQALEKYGIPDFDF